MEDQSQIRQAITDFDMFLSGKRAPALVGQSLATIIQLDIPRLVSIIMSWASNNRGQSLIESLIGARNKVFDIFFYRIARFESIQNFFPAFEQALVTTCPLAERTQLAAFFQQFKWQDIRPIGIIRDQQFIIE